MRTENRNIYTNSNRTDRKSKVKPGDYIRSYKRSVVTSEEHSAYFVGFSGLPTSRECCIMTYLATCFVNRTIVMFFHLMLSKQIPSASSLLAALVRYSGWLYLL